LFYTGVKLVLSP